jgi:hypothetical protein
MAQRRLAVALLLALFLGCASAAAQAQSGLAAASHAVHKHKKKLRRAVKAAQTSDCADEDAACLAANPPCDPHSAAVADK